VLLELSNALLHTEQFDEAAIYFKQLCTITEKCDGHESYELAVYHVRY